MAIPIRIDRAAVAAEPYLVWNAYIDIVALNTYDDLTPVQRIAHLIFWYEFEFHNGGFLQYFHNHGTSRLAEVATALETVGAPDHAALLRNTATLYLSRHRQPFTSVEDYVDAALEPDFLQADSAFHQCQPSLEQALAQYPSQNLTGFVEIV